MDHKNIISLSMIATVFDEEKLFDFDKIDRIFNNCGISELYIENAKYFQQYIFNKGFSNPNPEFNVYYGLNNSLKYLNENNNELLLKFLIKLFENIDYEFIEKIMLDNKNVDIKIKELERIYNSLGLSIKIENKKYIVSKLSEGVEGKVDNIYDLTNWLDKKHSEAKKSYESAINSYRNGDSGACIESCRTTLTSLFESYKQTNESRAKWIRGFSIVSGEFDTEELEQSKRDLSEVIKNNDWCAIFFNENLNGRYTKTKAIYSIYSMMSDYGTHLNEGIKENIRIEDALFMLRLTEDILIWVMQTN